MLQVINLKKSYGGQVLFDGASLFINDNDRVALIGANGTGKTTLFRMINGQEHPDSGEVVYRKDLRVGFLPQETGDMSGATLINEVAIGSSETAYIQKRMAELEHEMSDPNHPKLESHLEEYGVLQTRFEQIGGYERIPKAKKILAGLGFKESDLDRNISEFSGGWRMRILIARILLDSPEVMILDEPTNHLDFYSLLWFRDYLASYQGALLFTSHDREFINKLAFRVVELADGKLTDYPGNYDHYLVEKEIRKNQLVAAGKQQSREIKKAELFISRFKASANRASSVQSKMKALSKIERIVLPTEAKTIKINFPEPSPSGKEVFQLNKIHQSYGSREIYKGIDLTIYRGEKIILLGPNGAGKSTLLKIIAGVLPFSSGERKIGTNVSLSYYPQHRLDRLDPEKTCLEEVESSAPTRSPEELRGLLGHFLLQGDDVFKKVKLLSGGEKSRLLLVKILVNPPNFILLDEPTTHLDISSRGLLIEALKEYTGTMCFISHDQYFIRQVANKVIEVNNGVLTPYSGGYDYFEFKKKLMAEGKEESDELKEQPIKQLKKQAVEKPEPIKIAFEGHRPEKARKINKYKVAEKIKKTAYLESEINKLSKRYDELNGILADPETYHQPGFVDLVKEHETLKTDIDKLTSEWVGLNEQSTGEI